MPLNLLGCLGNFKIYILEILWRFCDVRECLRLSRKVKRYSIVKSKEYLLGISTEIRVIWEILRIY